MHQVLPLQRMQQQTVILHTRWKMLHSIWLAVWDWVSIPQRSDRMLGCVLLSWINTIHWSEYSISYPTREFVLSHQSEWPNNLGVVWFFASCSQCRVLACLLLGWEPSSLLDQWQARNTGCFLWPVGYVLCQYPWGVGKYLWAVGVARCYRIGSAVEYTGNVVVWQGLHAFISGVVWWYTQASKYPEYNRPNSISTDATVAVAIPIFGEFKLFLEAFYQMVDILFVDAFHAKVVDHQGEQYVPCRVIPQSRHLLHS